MMWCRVDRVVIRDAARLRGFRPDYGAPSLSDYTARVIGGNWGKLMYCGAVEFVCSPSAVSHIPVLLDECMGHLNPYAGGFFADLTFGGGGHSGKILEANAGSRLLAMDCDPDAKAQAESLSESYGDRFKFVDSAFQTVDQYAGAEEFDGVLMDLGISSFQLMEARKGFHSD